MVTGSRSGTAWVITVRFSGTWPDFTASEDLLESYL
jgi:hypothetical protein